MAKEKNEAKEYLLQVERLEVTIDSLLEQIAHLDELATKVTTVLKPDVISGGGNHDKIGDAAATIADLKRELVERVKESKDKKQEILSIIDKVTDVDQAKVLYKRYAFFQPLEQIALEMHCTYRNVRYIHGRALQTVTELMKGKEHGSKE